VRRKPGGDEWIDGFCPALSAAMHKSINPIIRLRAAAGLVKLVL
jgi:hypothetical protein